VGTPSTVIDLNTFEPIQNIVVEDAKPVGFPSSPVEVLFVRPKASWRGVAPAVLVNTMFRIRNLEDSRTARRTRVLARR